MSDSSQLGPSILFTLSCGCLNNAVDKAGMQPGRFISNR